MTQKREQKEQPSSSTTPTPEAQAPAQAERRPFETYLPGLPAWQQAAVRAYADWPQGREVTRAEFDKALEGSTKEAIE
ncbi:hypothetical protein [Deinococcus petrolearius]|uniref:Uncharacterized protein n=1 Tax=Deinococcus petrolearius TaxID=1751295 RepID=A0ABW1DER0_9DEIO